MSTGGHFGPPPRKWTKPGNCSRKPTTCFHPSRTPKPVNAAICLTGDRKYLAPYEKAVAALPGELSVLAATAAAAHREIKQVAYIQTLIHDKMADLKRTIDVRDQVGDEAALAADADG